MALDAMGRSMDRLQEISMKIHKSHLTYLQTDDSPSKIQKRLKLEGKHCTCFCYLLIHVLSFIVDCGWMEAMTLN